MGGDGLQRAHNTLHRALAKISGRRLGWPPGRLPILHVTTTGRRSGEARRTELGSPLWTDDGIVLVASAYGAPSDPDWYRNLVAEPAVTVTTPAGDRPMRARTATGEERAELWARITRRFPHYLEFQTRTERVIPVVVLEPEH